MGLRSPFIPLFSRNVGLIEKRHSVSSWLNLVGTVNFSGDFNHSASNTLLLDYDVEDHVNHGEDPASQSLNLSSNAGQVVERPRAVESVLTLNDHAHAALEGYHPPGTGNGDADLTKHIMTASGTINKGQPLYVSSSNTVTTANANPGSPIPNYSVAYSIGLAGDDATTGQDVTVHCEGSVEQDDWSLVAGTANLTAGALYYLDSTAGLLTTTPLTTNGLVSIKIGRALTTKKIDIEISDPVIL